MQGEYGCLGNSPRDWRQLQLLLLRQCQLRLPHLSQHQQQQVWVAAVPFQMRSQPGKRGLTPRKRRSGHASRRRWTRRFRPWLLRGA